VYESAAGRLKRSEPRGPGRLQVVSDTRDDGQHPGCWRIELEVRRLEPAGDLPDAHSRANGELRYHERLHRRGLRLDLRVRSTGNWRVKLVSAGTASVDTLVDSSGTGVICEKAQRFGSAPPETPPDPDEAIEIAQCGDDNTDGIADANGAYEGGVIGKSTIRSSDHNNCDSPCVGTNTGTEAGTVVDFDFGFPVGCTAGTCTLSSSANTLLAGSVTNGKQSSVEIISVRSLDPGPDGDIAGAACPLNCGNGNEKDFARQGLFWK